MVGGGKGSVWVGGGDVTVWAQAWQPPANVENPAMTARKRDARRCLATVKSNCTIISRTRTTPRSPDFGLLSKVIDPRARRRSGDPNL
jgi:hypothetical protein